MYNKNRMEIGFLYQELDYQYKFNEIYNDIFNMMHKKYNPTNSLGPIMTYMVDKDYIDFLMENNERKKLIPKWIENYEKQLLKCIKETPKFDNEELCKETFKPSRIMYQLSLDSDYEYS